MRLLFVLLVFFTSFTLTNGFCQKVLAKREFTFLFYNTENFFDCENDPLTNDDEFTPSGNRRWTPARLRAKTERLAKVIATAGKWNPPAFVGLCEVENITVLDLLVNSSPLKKNDYRIILKESADERGIDVAFIYRPDLFKPFNYQSFPLVDPSDQLFRTRDILLVSGVLNAKDTLHVFVNHWPSRYGGLMETVRYRKLAANKLKEAIENLYLHYPKARIICMGDFNDEPNDVSLKEVLGAIPDRNSFPDGKMINLSAAWSSCSVKTLKNQYIWQIFDQWIVSDYFLENRSGLRFLEAKILDDHFLLEPDLKFGGFKPKRTYVGFTYQEGFSDHLPIVLRVESAY